MALRSNAHEIPAMTRFCRQYTKDFFRFDPLVHLRFDGDPNRNKIIRKERLSPSEIVAIEQAEEEHSRALREECKINGDPLFQTDKGRYLFSCGAGQDSFSISYNGLFHLCSSLWHPDCTYDLRQGRLKEAWFRLVPEVRAMTSSLPEFLENCHSCSLFNICLWCPAHAYLETGRMDGWVEYFCQVAKARAEAFKRA
jgi:radical SAM protein with 4Fe4S-binding SPASM domain